MMRLETVKRTGGCESAEVLFSPQTVKGEGEGEEHTVG